jgi:KamA family protein
MSTTGTSSAVAGRRFVALTARHLDEITRRAGLDADERLAVRAVATVLPFRTNRYVLDELIDWSAAPDDPLYRLVVPQADMLNTEDLALVTDLLRADAPRQQLDQAVRDIRLRLNPAPGGQLELNVPRDGEDMLPGLQHKYRETVLVFPRQGQTCHAYCTYCFRWSQFVGEPDLHIATDDVDALLRYLRRRPHVMNVLLTGGDPMIMSHGVLSRYIRPLLALEQLESIRIGTKALAYWPQRWVTDPDADDTLRLFEEVVGAGKCLALMAHCSHPRELGTQLAEAAVRRIRATGAVVRTQAPLIRTVNDSADVWQAMWGRQQRLGMVPYYMFVERDTGPREYFGVPLARAWEIFSAAYASIAGLGRTVRGPSMSATPGKVVVDGVAEVHGRKVFVLRFIQARDPALVNRPFFARYDEQALWLDDLEPVDGLPWLVPGTGQGSA